MMAMLNSPFRYARKGWQKQYSSLIIPYQVTEYLARRCFLSAANQFHLRNINFDCEEIWHTATEVGNPRALEYSSSTALLGHFSPWRSVFFSWLLKFNYFCFAIGVFLVCFFSLSQKNIWDLKKNYILTAFSSPFGGIDYKKKWKESCSSLWRFFKWAHYVAGVPAGCARGNIQQPDLEQNGNMEFILCFLTEPKVG